MCGGAFECVPVCVLGLKRKSWRKKREKVKKIDLGNHLYMMSRVQLSPKIKVLNTIINQSFQENSYNNYNNTAKSIPELKI